MSVIAETKRLLLRRWHEDDRSVFRAMNADPQVMAHFPGTLTTQQSDELLDVIMAEPANQGMCAVEVKSTGQIAGACGIYKANLGNLVPEGTMEIAWRFIPSQWGQGYAREAAKEWLDIGFEQLKLEKIFAWAPETNKRSVAVMKGIGMSRAPEFDFVHPRVPDAYPQLKKHVVCTIDKAQWQAD